MLNLDLAKEFLKDEVEKKSESVVKKLEILCSRIRSSNSVTDTDIGNIVTHLTDLKKTASSLETLEILIESRDGDGDLGDFLNLI